MRIAWNSFDVQKKTLVVLNFQNNATFDPPNGPLDFIYLSTSTVRRNRDPTSRGFVYVISREIIMLGCGGSLLKKCLG